MEREVDQAHLFDRLLFQNDAIIYQLGRLLIIGRALVVLQSLLLFTALLHLLFVTFK